jgi:transcriptional regulator with XRE-family HTH domain
MSRKKTSAPPAAGHETVDTITRNLGGRIRELRNRRGWSLEELAKSSGVSRSMLSQIERQRTNPTLNVALRIARALEVELGELLQAPGVSSRITVIRAGDRAYLYRSDKYCAIRTLSPLNLEKDVELYEVRLQPGGALRSSAHYEGTREFLTVARGHVRVESAADREELEVGDSASYRADVPHAIINRGPSEAVVFLVVIYQ